MSEPLLLVEDLSRVYFRAQDAQGQWVNVNARESTDEQFDRWIRSRIEVMGIHTWSLAAHLIACDLLFQNGALYLVTKEDA